MDITNTAVDVLEHCESGEEDTILEKVDQGELEVKTTHDLPGAPQGGPVQKGPRISHNQAVPNEDDDEGSYNMAHLILSSSTTSVIDVLHIDIHISS